jgi:uncharacterized coiled-coil protein SlyX
MAATDMNERFLILETKVAYQDKLLQDLGEVILNRSREIDSLIARVLLLERVLQDDAREDPGHERPPHY